MRNWCEPTATGNEEILAEARVEPIAMVMRRGRLDWFKQVKRRDEPLNSRGVAETNMQVKLPRGRPTLGFGERTLLEESYTIYYQSSAASIRCENLQHPTSTIGQD